MCGPKSCGEGSFITYEASAPKKCLNIKVTEVVSIARVFQLWSLRVRKMVSPWSNFFDDQIWSMPF
jgi:hypothetical protein